MRIEIFGNIASGKTTLAELLGSELKCILEDFRSNPFLESFYEDAKAFCFETELSFTLQHYHQIKRALSNGISFVCDFSLLLDQSYADVTLSGRRHNLYTLLLAELEEELGPPDVVIRLKCGEEDLLERIRRRGRTHENSIFIDYLASLSVSLCERFEKTDPSTRVIEIDSGTLNFAHDERTRKSVKQVILSQI